MEFSKPKEREKEPKPYFSVQEDQNPTPKQYAPLHYKAYAQPFRSEKPINKINFSIQSKQT